METVVFGLTHFFAPLSAKCKYFIPAVFFQEVTERLILELRLTLPCLYLLCFVLSCFFFSLCRAEGDFSLKTALN